jgi:hypothetical protein
MYLTRNTRYSNAIDLCFFDKACIKRRQESEALAAQQLAEQQRLLEQTLNTKTSGLNAWAITGIIVGLTGLTFLTLFLIKKHTI